MLPEFQHLDLVDASLCDRVGLGVTKKAEAVELFDVVDRRELPLPPLMEDGVATDAVSLYQLARRVAKLVINLSHDEVQPIYILLEPLLIEDDLSPHPVVSHALAQALKLRVECPPHEVVDEVRVLGRVGLPLWVPHGEVENLKGRTFCFSHESRGRVSMDSTSGQ